jgi:hypothetical protein
MNQKKRWNREQETLLAFWEVGGVYLSGEIKKESVQS